jgi:vacuolar-type H+-ATPase subunit I/STV1
MMSMVPGRDVHGALLCIANPVFCVWFTLTPSHLSLAWHGLTPHKQNIGITWMLFGGIIGIIIIMVCLIVFFLNCVLWASGCVDVVLARQCPVLLCGSGICGGCECHVVTHTKEKIIVVECRIQSSIYELVR